MTTVGEILKTAREKRKLTIAQAEGATKIRAKFLEAIEQNNFDLLPPGTFTRGFIKNYASYLGVSPDDALAFYRRQTTVEKPAQTKEEKDRRIHRGFQITPQLFTSISLATLVFLFLAYLIYSYFTFAGAPSLLVSSPKNNIVVKSESVSVIGKTDPDAKLSINEETVGLSENGSFEQNITLHPGINTLKIVSENKFKKQTVVTKTLRLEK